MHNIFKSLIFGLVALFTNPIYAQLTEKNVSVGSEFIKAIHLFDQGMYAASRDAFTKLLSEGGLSRNRQEEAEYYRAISAIELMHPDADFLIERFLIDYSASSRGNQAKMYMADFQFKNRQYKKAMHYYNGVEKSLLDKEERAKVEFQHGYSLFMQGDVEEAKKLLGGLVNQKTDYTASATYYFAHIAYQDSSYNQALVNFKKLENDPTFGGLVPYYLAHVYYKLGNFDGLLEVGKPILELEEPVRAAEIAKLVGDAYYRKKDYINALKYFELFVEKGGKPGKSDFYEMGYTYYQNKKYEEALNFFNKITTGETEIAQNAWYLLGDCYMKMGQKNEAASAFKAASKIKASPTLAEDAAYNYVKLNYEIGSPFQDPMTALEDFLKLYPNSRHKREINELLANVYTNSKNYNRALIALENTGLESQHLKAAFQKVTYNLGNRSYLAKQFKNAIDAYQKSLQYRIDPEIAALSHYWLAESYFQMMEYEAALKGYQSFQNQPTAFNLKEYPYSIYGVAYCYYKLQNFTLAASNFRKFTSETKIDINKRRDALLRTGDAYMLLAQYEQAVEFYTRAEQAGGNSVDYARYQKATGLGLLGKTEQKINELNLLISKHTNSPYNINAQIELGNTYLRDDKYPQAIGAFDAFIQKNEGHPFVKRAKLNKSLALKNDKKPQEALVILKQIVQEYPGTQEGLEALQLAKLVYNDMNRIGDYVSWVESNKLGNISRNQLDSTLYNSAYEQYALSKFREAIYGFEEYGQKFPEGLFTIRAQYFRADAHWRLQEREKALPLLEALAARNNHEYSEQVLSRLGNYYTENKDWNQAQIIFEKLKTVATRKVNIETAQNQLMRIYLKLNNWNKALDAALDIELRGSLEKSLEQEVLFTKSLAQYNLNEIPKAEAGFNQLIQTAQGTYKAEAMYYKAELEYNNLSYESAKKLLYDLMEEFPEFVHLRMKSLLLLGKTFIAQKDYFQAEFAIDFVLQSSTDDELLSQARALKSQLKELQKEQE